MKTYLSSEDLNLKLCPSFFPKERCDAYLKCVVKYYFIICDLLTKLTSTNFAEKKDLSFSFIKMSN